MATDQQTSKHVQRHSNALQTASGSEQAVKPLRPPSRLDRQHLVCL